METMAENARVLIVDEDVETRGDLQRRLVKSQFVVAGACGYGAQALSLASEVAPKAVLVGVEEPMVRPLQTIEALCGVLSHVPVIAYSSRTDAESARRAVLAGARDYVTKPFKPRQPAQSILDALEQLESRQAREGGQAARPVASGIVITVYGAKGGIGKTTIAANLATALAHVTGGSVALADMDTQFGDVAIMMDIAVERTIVELARRADEVDRELVRDYLVRHWSQVQVLPAPFEPSEWQAITPPQMEKIIVALAQTHDFVVLDTAAIFNDLVAVALDKANIVLLVTSMDISSIKNTVIVLKLLASSSFPQEKVKLTINHASSANTLKEEDVKTVLNQEVFWRIPYDEAVGASVQLGKPVVVARPRSRVSQSILDLAAFLSGTETALQPHGRGGWFSRLLARRA
jgi:pilus assembly protein CpaE